MKVSITTTFSFGKLANFLEDNIKGYRESIAQTAVDSAKEYIQSGSITPDLTNKNTLAWRKRIGASHNKPLLATEKLVNSLKVKKTGISGMEYGTFHLEGKGVLKRNFFDQSSTDFMKKSKSKTDKFISDMRKALKK